MTLQVQPYGVPINRPAPPLKGDNGHGNKGHFCIQADRIQGLEEAVFSMLGDMSEMRQTIGKAPSMDGSPGEGMAGMIYKIANHVVFGGPRGALESLSDGVDWELDEPTGLHGPAVWAKRAKEAGETVDTMGAEIAALKATIAERDRHSERARAIARQGTEVSMQKWKLVAGLVATVLGSASATTLLAYLLGG